MQKYSRRVHSFADSARTRLLKVQHAGIEGYMTWINFDEHVRCASYKTPEMYAK